MFDLLMTMCSETFLVDEIDSKELYRNLESCSSCLHCQHGCLSLLCLACCILSVAYPRIWQNDRCNRPRSCQFSCGTPLRCVTPTKSKLRYWLTVCWSRSYARQSRDFSAGCALLSALYRTIGLLRTELAALWLWVSTKIYTANLLD